MNTDVTRPPWVYLPDESRELKIPKPIRVNSCLSGVRLKFLRPTVREFPEIQSDHRCRIQSVVALNLREPFAGVSPAHPEPGSR